MNSTIRSGKWSLILSLGLIAWLGLVSVLTSLSTTSEVAANFAAVMFLASWLVVPVLIVGVLVFAVIALLLNPVRGKILAAIAVVAPFVAFAIGVAVTGGFDSA